MIKIFKIIIEFLKSFFKKDNGTNSAIIENDNNDNGNVNCQDENNSNISDIEDNMQELVSNMIILIDNGHGKNTPGKRSPYSLCGEEPPLDFYEYEWNREIAKRIVDTLKELKYDARLLVTEIEDISLKDRVKRVNEICKEHGISNVILISIHSNAAGNGTKWMNAEGWSAYTTKGKTKSDILAEYLYDEAEKNFTDRKIRTDKSDGDRDWESDFYIIYNSKCPSVLTENFFYDNVEDLMYIQSTNGKDAIVKTHVDGIINYIKSIENE